MQGPGRNPGALGFLGRLVTFRLPVSVIFLFHGLVLGAWATQVPLLRDRLNISPGRLGMALFCISVGAIAAMPFASGMAARIGVALLLRAGAVLACACFVLAAGAPSYPVLCAALLGFGVGYGTVDVAMNACAVQQEQQAGRPILGTVHAMWSVGGFAGSACGAGLLTVVAPLAQAAVLAGAAATAIVLAAGRTAPLRVAAETTSPDAHRPWRDSRLLGLGILLCVAFARGRRHRRLGRHLSAYGAARAEILCRAGLQRVLAVHGAHAVPGRQAARPGQ